MLYTMFLMVLLTFIVGSITLKYRYSLVKSGVLHQKYFQLMKESEVPEFFTKSKHCFSNMFEVPVLYYVVCTLYISLGIDSYIGLLLAWFFVLMRYFQAYVHLTYNWVFHRMLSFWLSFLSVIGLWINLLCLT